MGSVRVVVDCRMLSRPYRLKRCTYHLLHFALIFRRLGYNVRLLTHAEHLEQHGFLKPFADLLGDDFDGCDLYLAKSDTFYIDSNFEKIVGKARFTVCLNSSDRCFRETSIPWKSHVGHAVQNRCDLYMPVNHTNLVSELPHMISVAHPVDPRIVQLLAVNHLYEAYLDDDLQSIRNHFNYKSKPRLGFFGGAYPLKHRFQPVSEMKLPDWVDIVWETNRSPAEYVEFLVEHEGCLDLRGFGDKSLRFTEAVLFGKAIVRQPTVSTYNPALVSGGNCVEIGDLKAIEGWHHWLTSSECAKITEQATNDYVTGWSMRAQAVTMLHQAGIL